MKNDLESLYEFTGQTIEYLQEAIQLMEETGACGDHICIQVHEGVYANIIDGLCVIRAHIAKMVDEYDQ